MGAWKGKYKRWKRWLIDGALLRGWRFKMPDMLIIEPTNRCTLACSCCPHGHSEPLHCAGVMSRDTFDTLLRAIDIPVKYCYLHFCGEPLLNPDIAYMAAKIRERGITPVVFSNGYGVNTDTLRQLVAVKGLKMSFSADLINPRHYESIRRPGKYERMVKSLDDINRVFKEANRFYGLNVIISGDLSLEEIQEACERMFARYSQLNNISLNSRWPWPKLPDTGDLARHLVGGRPMCDRYKSTMPIMWNGDVTFCESDFAGDTIVGNINAGSYRKLYNSPAARRIRRRWFMGRENRQPLCRDCLLPRYEAFTLTLYRKKFMNSDPQERRESLKDISHYYEI